jgi:purine nucleosidase
LSHGNPQKILFDTDIGSDIDDAVALAWLLANPHCELVGITTVSGQPVERAKLASVLCKVAGVDIPIVPGAATPLQIEARQPIAQQSPSLERWPHDETFISEDAIDFMADLIARNPGEITLLAVGPMTNVARLFEHNPEAAQQLRQIVLMLGKFGPEQIGPRPAEWNTFCDPHAAEAVFNSQASRMRAVGLDVTTQVRMEVGEVRNRFDSPLLAPVLDMAEEWFSRRPLITFHDPLAAVTIFDDQLCEFERGAASVATATGQDQGTIDWQPTEDGTLEVGVSVDPGRFFERYFEVF